MKLSSARPADMTPVRGRGFWPMRDIPTALWLVLTVAATIAHRELPEPRWLMIHLLLLGAVTHAILVWSNYFSFALLRSKATAADRRTQNLRLILSNGGVALVFVGVPSQVWALTVAGASCLIVAVAWHGISLFRRLRSSLAGQFGGTVRYYIAAAGLLTIGAALGAFIARDGAPNLVLAHALINVLGWIGLTVAGTIVTLWPTILRTRADEHASTGAARALPVLAAGVVAAALGAALTWLPLLALGLTSYLAGLGVIGVSLWRAARRARPHSFAALSVGMALTWWADCIVVVIAATVVSMLDGSGFASLTGVFDQVVPYLAAGFAAQVLIGALSYLVPVVLGGGPTPVRVGTAAFDRFGPLRVAVANVALVVCALPVSSLMRVVASILYLIAMASFLVFMTLGMRAQRRAKTAGPTRGDQAPGRAIREAAPHASGPMTGPRAGQAVGGDSQHASTPVAGRAKVGTAAGTHAPEPARGRRAGQAVAGLLTVVLAVAITAAADPMALGWSASPTGDADAPVTTVQVDAADMRFTPNVIEVPAGNRLVVEITNTDASQTHDLVFANGIAGDRLAPGESQTIDVGVVTEALDGWCSIVGHRQMGMTLSVVVAGEHSDHAADAGAPDSMTDSGSGSALGSMDDEPPAGFEAFDAVLPPLPAANGPTTHEITLNVEDTVLPVAPGVTQTLWTYNRTAPGPTLHGRVGDKFVITLVNSATMGHSIDFHAGALAPDEPMRTIQPGEQLTYTFTATRAGMWMYHCSTMPMTAHIANGMYGAVVIEPDDLPAVDRSYVLVQGEYYLGDADGGEVDVDKIAEGDPDLVVFNGYANQYDHAALPATVGERVRVWVLNAGIERSSSFHVIGGQFDTVWAEGAYSLDHSVDTGSQSLGLMPAQGGFVELGFPEEGHYPFVSHYMIDAERGAHGIFEVGDADTAP